MRALHSTYSPIRKLKPALPEPGPGETLVDVTCVNITALRAVTGRILSMVQDPPPPGMTPSGFRQTDVEEYNIIEFPRDSVESLHSLIPSTALRVNEWNIPSHPIMTDWNHSAVPDNISKYRSLCNSKPPGTKAKKR